MHDAATAYGCAKGFDPQRVLDAIAGVPARATQRNGRVESLVLLLEMMGHSASRATDGASALAAARELRPDVMLVDIGLPDFSGYELARAVRADHSLAQAREPRRAARRARPTRRAAAAPAFRGLNVARRRRGGWLATGDAAACTALSSADEPQPVGPDRSGAQPTAA